jgi:hypothetical protein
MGTSSRFSTKREDIAVVVMEKGMVAQVVCEGEIFRRAL